MQLNDQVRTKITGQTGRVVTMANMVGIHFDNGECAIFDISAVEPVPSPAIEAPRAFKVGQYVIMDNEFIGEVTEDDGDDEDEAPYTVRDIYNGVENLWSAEDLELWSPEPHERVVTTDDEDNAGTVLAVSETHALVLWDEFPTPQEWELDDLAPYEGEDNAPEFKRGNAVVYTRGFLRTGPTATVIGDQAGGIIGVRWHKDHFKYDGRLDGFYSADCFDHYHESVLSDAA